MEPAVECRRQLAITGQAIEDAGIRVRHLGDGTRRRYNCGPMATPTLPPQRRDRDLTTGRERQLSATPQAPLNPIMSADGRWAAYTVTTDERGGNAGPGVGYVVETSGGAPRRVCERCQIFYWSRDDRQLFVVEEEARHALADLIAEGDRRQWANRRFRLELAAWVHPNRSAARDGIPGYAQGVDDLMSYAGPLVVRTFNMGEGQTAPVWEFETPSVALQGKLEMEIAQLPPDEAAMFLAEYGLEESSLARMIHMAYQILGVQSFFTVGEDEVRAWETKRGATAQEAAGEVHTDLQKGFVRAEVVAYDDLISLGSMQEAKAKGKLRLEGKEYPVKDGDIVHIRSSL